MEYLKSSDKYVSRMQLDYLWSPKKEFYAKVSAGIFEMMYGGIGTEVLYKPFDSKLMVGLENSMMFFKKLFQLQDQLRWMNLLVGFLNLQN